MWGGLRVLPKPVYFTAIQALESHGRFSTQGMYRNQI